MTARTAFDATERVVIPAARDATIGTPWFVRSEHVGFVPVADRWRIHPVRERDRRRGTALARFERRLTVRTPPLSAASGRLRCHPLVSCHEWCGEPGRRAASTGSDSDRYLEPESPRLCRDRLPVRTTQTDKTTTPTHAGIAENRDPGDHPQQSLGVPERWATSRFRSVSIPVGPCQPIPITDDRSQFASIRFHLVSVLPLPLSSPSFPKPASRRRPGRSFDRERAG